MAGEGNPRRVRVAQTIREALSELIPAKVKDPRVHDVGLVSVNNVELNRDMSTARVFVSVYGSEERAARAAVAALSRASGFLRGELGRRLSLARAPELCFVYDTSPELRQRITEVVRDDERRAAARAPEDEDEEEDER